MPGTQIIRRSTKVRRSKSRLPSYCREDLDRVLIDEQKLKAKVAMLARKIQRDYEGKELVIVALLNGTVLFLADLIRCLEMPLRLDFIGISSYGGGTVPGELMFTKELRLDVRGRDVLLVDDILDTGRTVKKAIESLRELKPRSIRLCVLLEKKARRSEELAADYVGFQIPDRFVVGYGLDYAERYRNLPFVGILKTRIYTNK